MIQTTFKTPRSMNSSSSNRQVQRAKPLLGTLVEIKVQGLPLTEAHAAVDRGFAAVAEVHRLMSFHEHTSDVSHLNQKAHRQPIQVNSHTYKVLHRALDLASKTNGVFDPTIARELVAWDFLPQLNVAETPSSESTWQDIELQEDNVVKFHRPLWIDLGGIAKGYAVDCALNALELDTDTAVCVNAGGDLRVRGREPEIVHLRVEPVGQDIPVLRIENGSVASSSGYGLGTETAQGVTGPHLDGTRRCAVGAHSFTAVLAEDCMTADALTKVVLAKGLQSEEILRNEGAAAYLYDAQAGWNTLGVQS